MKMKRLIGIITLLLQHEKLTAPELARRFEVSRKTINRDIEDICMAGIPVVTMQGYGGGIYLDERYKIDRSLFTPDEILTIYAGLKSLGSVDACPAIKDIMEKLSFGKDSFTPDDCLVIDLSSHYRDSLSAKIALLKEAASARRLVTFSYYYRKGECNRTIEPYRILFQYSSWYVLGYCTEKEDFRFFKLNRLWDLEDTGAFFEGRPVTEELLSFEPYWREARYPLSALFHPAEKYRLIEEYGNSCFTQEGDGRLLFNRSFSSYEEMRNWVFSFGDHVKVLSPELLISDILANINTLAKLYKEQDT